MKYVKFPNDLVLEAALRKRSVEAPSAGLAARIAATAARVARQSPAINIAEWVQELFADSIPLRPAYVFATVLIVGFTFGFAVLPALTTDDQTLSTQIVSADEGDAP
jgi:hypothetical protein